MKINRRSFLHQTALGVGGALVGAPLLARADTNPARSFDPYELVPLGKTPLKASRFSLGTGMRGGNRESNQKRLGKPKFEALIRGAYDRGVRLFDMADLYGTHGYFADAIKGQPRDQYRIVSKIWFHDGGIPESERPGADVVVARFLKELKTDYIDLLLLHCVISPNWPTELRRQMDLMAELKSKGVLRAVGVSCHSVGALEAAANEPWVDSVHTRINPYGMSMDDRPNVVVPILRKICAAGKGVVGMKIIGEGRLRNDPDKRDASIKYALTLDCVDVMIVGCESLEEVDDFATRVRKVTQAAV